MEKNEIEKLQHEAAMKFPLQTRANTSQQKLISTIIRNEFPDYAQRAFDILNKQVLSRRAAYVDKAMEEKETRLKNEERIKRQVEKIIEENIKVFVNNRSVKYSDKFKGQCGKKISLWDLILIPTKGNKFLLGFGDPEVDAAACRSAVINRMPDWDFPKFSILQNCKEVERRYDYGRPDEIWEHYILRFEVR